MELDDIETLVHDAMQRLPEWVHDALDNVEVLVLEEPTDAPGVDGDDLLGLYAGVPLAERGADYFLELPDVIYIFRRPHLEMGLTASGLRDGIVTTLYHEIAHYFGIDDDRLDELGWG